MRLKKFDTFQFFSIGLALAASAAAIPLLCDMPNLHVNSAQYGHSLGSDPVGSSEAARSAL